MSGSHSPYAIRYPKSFEKFKINLVSKRQNIINAYDNSVLYSDFTLNSLISYLQKNSKKEFYFLYSSDHGEAVGEHNRFGHGLLFKEAMLIPFLYATNSNKNPFKKIKHISELNIAQVVANFLGYDVKIDDKKLNYVTGSDITGLAGYAIVEFDGKKIISLKKINP
jgi:lipid A ethanolaminephosphotransferase